jgi:outer membrane protein assembly factor BamB
MISANLARTIRLVFSGISLLGISACAGATRTDLFSSDWSDDQGRSILVVQSKLRGTHAPPGANIVIGIAGHGNLIIAQPLGNGAKWTFAHPLDARPFLTGDLVIGSGGGELFALDAATGKKLWARATGGLPVYGAGDDGATTVVSLTRSGGVGSTLLAIARDGAVVRQVESSHVLGIPAVMGGYAFVPWDDQYVSVLDIANGDEPARILVREKTSHAWTVGGALYFGEVGIFRFDDRITQASKNEASHLSLPARELPGSPDLMNPPAERQSPVATARDRVHLYARPGAYEQPLHLDGDRFYATYFRFVMGLSGAGHLAWVHTHPTNVIAGAAGAGALVVCDEAGKVTILGAGHGEVLKQLDLGQPLQSCVVQVDDLAAPTSQAALTSLPDDLSVALRDNDAQLVSAQRLFLRELATENEESATKVLVDLASAPQTPPVLLVDARAALATRQNGAEYMRAALAKRYDFLKDVLRAPPVGPIAQALASMKDASAAPLLADHLFDPADTDDDVMQTAKALAVLGGPPQLPTLKEFFSVYHASAENTEITSAVVSVGESLLRFGGKDGRALVDKAIADPNTVPEISAKLKGLEQAADANAQEAPTK